MNSEVRIIKRNRGLQSSSPGQDKKTGRQSDREIAGTVKNWIVELAQRRRSDELAARTRLLIPPTAAGGTVQILSTPTRKTVESHQR